MFLAVLFQIGQSGSLPVDVGEIGIAFRRDLAISSFIMKPNCSLNSANRSDKRFTVGQDSYSRFSSRTRRDLLGSAVGKPHPPDMGCTASGVTRQVNPFPIWRPRCRIAATVWSNLGPRRTDRKSTRLNSSHTVISY